MRATGVRKGKGNGADADTVSVQSQQTTLSYRVAVISSNMSSMRAVLSSQVVLITVFVISVHCAELIDKEILGVKQTLDNSDDKNVTFLDATVKNGKNSSSLVVGDRNSMSGSSIVVQPETEEDLVSEMEELFKAMQLLGLDFDRNATDNSVSARMKMSDFMFNPVMLVPQLITWGFAPIILANLKMFVMQALMLNNMALNAAIFMTLRNIVFGPRPGPVVKYSNHGYHQHPPVHHHHHRRRS